MKSTRVPNTKIRINERKLWDFISKWILMNINVDSSIVSYILAIIFISISKQIFWPYPIWSISFKKKYLWLEWLSKRWYLLSLKLYFHLLISISWNFILCISCVNFLYTSQKKKKEFFSTKMTTIEIYSFRFVRYLKRTIG